jgi:hypothetical protein
MEAKTLGAHSVFSATSSIANAPINIVFSRSNLFAEFLRSHGFCDLSRLRDFIFTLI